MKEIYLDYAANTPVDKSVLELYTNTALDFFGNPNSTHIEGKKAKKVVDNATKSIKSNLEKFCNVEQDIEIIYTSGSSESNNLAIKGIAKTYRNYGKHIITTFLEHSSVSAPLTALKEQGYEIDIVQLDESGKVDLESLKELLRDDTILVSVCYVDSELGTLEPIEKIAQLVKKYPNCILHVDATQALGKIKINLRDVDLASFAPHKFYGINGSGVLLKKKDIILEPLIHGGSSTTIYRSGTPVTAEIVALDKALDIALSNLDNRFKYVNELNKYLRKKLSSYSKVRINSINEDNPYILNLSIDGVKAVDFKEELEKYNVCVSIKSACSTTLTPSRAVMAISKDRKRALSSWRISLSHLTTNEEIEEFINIFDVCYNKLTKGE